MSVGLPVYNGEQHLREAIDSLLAQDYANLEILVSDNASNDRTPEIVEQLAARDPRIRYSRNERNIGAPANFNRCFALTSGSYFMWAADDDVWEPTYVRRCLSALEAAPGAVLACSQMRFIDETGAAIEMNYTLADNPDLSSTSVVDRIRTLVSRGGWYLIYGVMRREALARTRLMTEAYGGDVVLVTELALQGPFVRVPEVLHRYRQTTGRTEADRVAGLGIEVTALKSNWWPKTVLEEGISDAVKVSRLSWATKARLRLEVLLGAYFWETPISAGTRRETPARVRHAVRHLRPRELAKYSTIWIVRGVLGTVRRSSTLRGRIARRVRRVLRRSARGVKRRRPALRIRRPRRDLSGRPDGVDR